MQKIVLSLLMLVLFGCTAPEDHEELAINEALAGVNRTPSQSEEKATSIDKELRQGLGKCTAIKSDLSRLDCFDGLARSSGLIEHTMLQESDNRTGNWRSNVTTNPLDDSKTVTLSLSSQKGGSRFDERPTLIVRCQSNTTEMYINWHEYLGNEAEVISRIGDEPAQTKWWSISTDHVATFYPGNKIAFLKQLMNVDKFVAQVTPYNESPVTAVFEISGLEEAIIPLRESCSW